MTTGGKLIGSSVFGGAMSKRDVYANNAALAVPFRYAAGHARALYEHAVGAAANDDCPACAEPNSRGLIGEDHSGAGYGKELKHSYWQAAGYPLTRIETTTAFDWSCQFSIPVPSGYPGTLYSTATLTMVFNVLDAMVDGYSFAYFSTDASGGYGGVESSINLEQTTGLRSSTCTVYMQPGQYNTLTFRLNATINDANKFEVEIYSLTLSQAG